MWRITTYTTTGVKWINGTSSEKRATQFAERMATKGLWTIIGDRHRVLYPPHQIAKIEIKEVPCH